MEGELANARYLGRGEARAAQVPLPPIPADEAQSDAQDASLPATIEDIELDIDAFIARHKEKGARQYDGTASAAAAIQRVHWHHDLMIKVMLTNPQWSQGDLAKHFGYTQAWISRIINSDAFRARYAELKADLIDPTVIMTLDENIRVLANRSAQVLLEKLESTHSPEIAMKALELGAKALGYGARQPQVAIQQSFVVALPDKAPDAGSWANRYTPAPAAQVVDVTPNP